MSNLDRKSLIKSTVFQYGILVDFIVFLLYVSDPNVTALNLITAITAGFVAYVSKEGIAKGAEAYRDRSNQYGA